MALGIGRIALVGNSGSGKSTLAQRLGALHGLVSLDLDTMAWEPGMIAVPRERTVAAAEVSAFCASHERWVVEGCYANLIHVALQHQPLLLLIDPGMEACLANCRRRPWEPHKYASKKEQDEKLEFLLLWVQEYYTRDDELSLAAHRVMFDAYRGPKRRVTQAVDQAFVDDLSTG